MPMYSVYYEVSLTDSILVSAVDEQTAKNTVERMVWGGQNLGRTQSLEIIEALEVESDGSED